MIAGSHSEKRTMRDYELWRWSFPSVESLRAAGLSGVESSVLAALLIVPLSMYIGGTEDLLGVGFAIMLPTLILVFFLLAAQLAGWVGFTVRVIYSGDAINWFAVVFVFGAYLILVVWAVSSVETLGSGVAGLQTLVAWRLVGFSWREWPSRYLYRVALCVCVAYFGAILLLQIAVL